VGSNEPDQENIVLFAFKQLAKSATTLQVCMHQISEPQWLWISEHNIHGFICAEQ
jgi:hypothetical protein